MVINNEPAEPGNTTSGAFFSNFLPVADYKFYY